MSNIIWFRSDLRTLDNPAVNAALTYNPTVATRAVFYVTEQQWLTHNWGANKIGFVLQHLLTLQQDLADLNIQLDIEYCADFKTLAPALVKYALQHNCKNLFYNQEYELNEKLRDQTVTQLFEKQDIKVSSYHSQTLIAPGLILNKQQAPYSVFTPFKKACYEYLFHNQPQLLTKPKPIKQQSVKSLTIDPRYQNYLDNPVLQQWQYGQQAALNILEEFCEHNVRQYQESRDFPDIDGTSKLSAYLAIGVLSVKQCFIAAISNNHQEFASGNNGVMCWISELLWRDFYKNIIFHYPDLCKGENFNAKYNRIQWHDPEPNLEKWQAGKTGVPIIDAAMRQLVTTGWMHNRLRMLVAMFLTKNLLIDWRHGEKFFSQHLIDLDFASNNGGWQWSASTGTDAVPYFRIFNPITQSQKFAADGLFIKKYCPELQSLTAKQIHSPSLNLSPTELANLKYPAPIVDINQSRIRAIEHFKTL